MRLWDVYNGLLTPTQQEITGLYFNLDLTVSEIAESKGITRQGVSDCLYTCKKQLEEYEDKLHFSKLLREGGLHLSYLTTDVARWAEDFSALHPEYAAEIRNLSDILDKDYGEEIAAGLLALSKQ